MKKVVHVFTISGSIAFLEGLAPILKDSGYELHVISSDGQEGQNGQAVGDFCFHPIYIHRGISIRSNLRSLRQVMRELKSIRPEIVHGHTPMGGLISMLAAKLLGIRNRVYTVHGLKYPEETGFRRFVVKTFESLSIALSTKTFAVSGALKDYLVKDRLAAASKIDVIGHGSIKGVDSREAEAIRTTNRRVLEERFGLKSGVFRFGFFGRITEEKGVNELFEAVELLKSGGCAFDLLLCGADEIVSEKTRKRLHALQEAGTVTWKGFVTAPLEYMRCCDCTVLPTHREGFGLVNIESNAVGVPVVTTDIMGCRDSIEDGKTGLFFRVGDAKDLAEKMDYMLRNDGERARMGQSGAARTKELFERSAIWTALVREYNRMAGETV